MKKYVLNSDELLNENVYCKLHTFRWYSLEKFFGYCADKITGYKDIIAENTKSGNSYFYFSWEYEKVYGKMFDMLDFYGIKTDFVETEKGDKFVFSLDDKHSFVFYPMCDEKKGGNELRKNPDTNTVTDPKYSVLVMYAVANGKATKIDGEFNHYYLADNNFKSHSDTKSADKVVSIMNDYVKSWGFDRLYAEKNDELAAIVKDVYTKKVERDEKERVARENKEMEETMRNSIRNKGAVMTVYYKGKEIRKIESAWSVDSALNIRYAFSLNAKLTLQYERDNEIHPDTSDMKNLDDSKPYVSRYTERNLPKDHYELVDYYRTHAGEVCEHCGKDPIVNVMVIRNPKGQIFHVGNECVSHLVDLPDEEFETEWNAPFKEANNMMAKVRNDKNKGMAGTWYKHKNKCYYVIENKDIFGFSLFGDKYVNDRGIFFGLSYVSDKVLKRDVSYIEKGAGFVKRMLPRWYAGSIETKVNIGDLIDMLYNGKNIVFTNFTYDGVDYKIPTTDDRRVSHKERPLIVEQRDFSVGEYSQKFEDAGYGLKNVTYVFGDVTIEYKWKTDE